MVVRPSLFSTRRYYSLFLLILYWFAKQNYRIGFVWLAYNVSVIYHLASLQFIHLILCYWQFSDSYSVNSFRQKPPRRLCWSCSARAASTTPSVPSRFVHLLSRTLHVYLCSVVLTQSFLFLCAEVQALWDRWRQEGQGNISLLNWFHLSGVVVVDNMSYYFDVRSWIETDLVMYANSSVLF
jgi:hypothetical protein